MRKLVAFVVVAVGAVTVACMAVLRVWHEVPAQPETPGFEFGLGMPSSLMTPQTSMVVASADFDALMREMSWLQLQIPADGLFEVDDEHAEFVLVVELLKGEDKISELRYWFNQNTGDAFKVDDRLRLVISGSLSIRPRFKCLENAKIAVDLDLSIRRQNFACKFVAGISESGSVELADAHKIIWRLIQN